MLATGCSGCSSEEGEIDCDGNLFSGSTLASEETRAESDVHTIEYDYGYDGETLENVELRFLDESGVQVGSYRAEYGDAVEVTFSDFPIDSNSGVYLGNFTTELVSGDLTINTDTTSTADHDSKEVFYRTNLRAEDADGSEVKFEIWITLKPEEETSEAWVAVPAADFSSSMLGDVEVVVGPEFEKFAVLSLDEETQVDEIDAFFERFDFDFEWEDTVGVGLAMNDTTWMGHLERTLVQCGDGAEFVESGLLPLLSMTTCESATLGRNLAAGGVLFAFATAGPTLGLGFALGMGLAAGSFALSASDMHKCLCEQGKAAGCDDRRCTSFADCSDFQCPADTCVEYTSGCTEGLCSCTMVGESCEPEEMSCEECKETCKSDECVKRTAVCHEGIRQDWQRTPQLCSCITETDACSENCSCSVEEPHLVTADGVGHAFHGAGEFILMESISGEDFTVQVRYEPCVSDTCPNVTCGTAVAAEVDGNRVGIYLDRDDPVWLNGEPVEVSSLPMNRGTSGFARVEITETSEDTFRVEWASGEVLYVEKRTGTFGSLMNLFLALEPSRHGQLQGLLGFYDGDPTNDFTDRQGNQFEEPLSWETLYGPYADSWRIHSDESLFDYEDGEDTHTFTNLQIPLAPTSPDLIDDQGREWAQGVCETAGVTEGPVMDDCIVDVFCLDDEEAATSHARRSQPTREADIEENWPGNCHAPLVLQNSDINGGVIIEEDSCYRVESYLVLNDGILTIEPGVTLTFGEHAGLRIRDQGALQVEGTENNQVVFTGAEDQRGYWRGLHFQPTDSVDNVLDNLVIEYAGSEPHSVSSRTQAGILVEGVELTVRNSTFREIDVSALTAEGTGSVLTLEGNHFVDNYLPLSVLPRLVEGIGENNTFEGNEVSVVKLFTSALQQSQTWPGLSVPFLVTDRLNIEANLTLSPGTIFLFEERAGLNMRGAAGGSLNADAGGGEQIIFRGVELTRGYWAGLDFNNSNSPNNVLNNVLIMDAGSHLMGVGEDTQTSILLRDSVALDTRSQLTITDTTIMGSGLHGIRVESRSFLYDCTGLAISDVLGLHISADTETCLDPE